MHLWRYIKKPTDVELKEDDFPSISKYNLYALTVDKELAKRFEKERDMNRFIKRVTKVSKEEYAEFANSHRGKVLTLQKIRTVENKNTNSQRIFNVELLVTQDEYQFAKEPQIPINYEGWWTSLDTFKLLFNKKIMKALEYLDFIDGYKLFDMGEQMTYEESLYNKLSEWKYDELAYFITLYGDTFK